RISNLQQQNSIYETVISKKDSIISVKDNIIGLQDKVINTKKPIQFHLYGGIEFQGFNFNDPIFYGKGALEFKRIGVGSRLNYAPVPISRNTSNIYITLNLEYKIL